MDTNDTVAPVNKNPSDGSYENEVKMIHKLVDVVSKTSSRNVAYYSLGHIVDQLNYKSLEERQFEMADELQNDLINYGFPTSILRDKNGNLELEISW